MPWCAPWLVVTLSVSYLYDIASLLRRRVVRDRRARWLYRLAPMDPADWINLFAPYMNSNNTTRSEGSTICRKRSTAQPPQLNRGLVLLRLDSTSLRAHHAIRVLTILLRKVCCRQHSVRTRPWACVSQTFCSTYWRRLPSTAQVSGYASSHRLSGETHSPP